VLERETDQIIGVIGQKTIGQSPSVSLRELLASDAHPAVRGFFRADVEAMLLEEYRTAVGTSRFNHDHPDVRTAQASLNSALVMHFAFQRKEYLARLADAVRVLANFLVRPQWTLTGVVFEKEPAVSVEALRRLMNYFTPYGYVKEVLFRYAADRKVSAFTKEEFSTLLWKIDAALVRRKTGQEICEVLLPLYEFFDYPRTSAKNAMPVKALIRYFEDKGLTDVQTRLEGELAQGVDGLTLEALAPILEDVRRTSGEFTAERPEPKPAVAAGEALPAPGVSAGAGAGQGAQAAPATGRGGPDIASAIADGERKKFIRKIFKQEDARYDDALRELSSMPGWKEASRYIDEIFIRNDVDPYSGEAERFIEIVFQQYHPPR
jgi:hypothetical protein